jgi:SAM-dependent methyltransferase
MKIVYLGNYTNLDADGKSYNTENHIALTLEKLGHDVTRIQETPVASPGWVDLVSEDTDLFLYTRTWGMMVTLEDLAALKGRGIPTASYHLDLYVGLNRQSGIESDPFWRTEYVFSADGDPESQKFFESKGINHRWLLAGVFEDECVMFEPNQDETLGGDVIFVGGGAEYGHPEWSYRHELVEWLERTYGTRYKKYGHPQRTVRGGDLNQLYANSKITIGDSVNIGFNHKNYTSDRLFESMGRGAFTIYPRIEGVAELFDEGVNAVWYDYGDFEGLKKTIDYYLEHDEEREAIRRAGFEFVKGNHTYTQRLQVLLNTITAEHSAKVKINLGAGTDQFEGFVNVDMIDLPGIDVVHNLIDFPYPFEDNCADEIRAVDVIEHLPPYIGKAHGVIKFIEECHRILKPGGTLYMQTPGWKAEFLWIDPTHVRGFDIQSMDFFDPAKPFGITTGFYSKCKFNVRAEELKNHNLRFWMTKI